MLTNAHGTPVFKGNTGDPRTLLPQVEKVRERFGLKRFILVGDRGMITQRQVDALRDIEGVDWIAALRGDAIHRLVDDAALQMDLFDKRNLFELSHSGTGSTPRRQTPAPARSHDPGVGEGAGHGGAQTPLRGQRHQ